MTVSMYPQSREKQMGYLANRDLSRYDTRKEKVPKRKAPTTLSLTTIQTPMQPTNHHDPITRGHICWNVEVPHWD
jgi:hypothetical protein